jgi:hypothetical protein
VTFLNSLALYVGQVCPLRLSSHHLLQPPKTIAKDSNVLFHIRMQSTSTIFTFTFPYLLHSSSPLPQIRPSVVPVLQSCPSFLIPESVFKGFSMYPSCEYTLLCQFTPSTTRPYPSFLPLLFNSVQCVSLYPPSARMQCISVLLALIFLSFVSPLSSID